MAIGGSDNDAGEGDGGRIKSDGDIGMTSIVMAYRAWDGPVDNAIDSKLVSPPRLKPNLYWYILPLNHENDGIGR